MKKIDPFTRSPCLFKRYSILVHIKLNLIVFFYLRVSFLKFLEINLFLQNNFLKNIPCHPTTTEILAFDPLENFLPVPLSDDFAIDAVFPLSHFLNPY